MSIYQPLNRPVRSGLAPKLGNELGNGRVELPASSIDLGGKLADMLLQDAISQRATDIHLDPQHGGMRVRFRIDGRLLDAVVLPVEVGSRVLRHFKALSGLDSGDRFHPADAHLTHVLDGKEVDLRIAYLPSVAGEKLSIRVLDRSRVFQTLDELGLTDDPRHRIEQWLANMSGMFLVAGPTGSGKTTTLYALLHQLRLHDRCVVTVEDPVEYHIDGVTQTQVDKRHGLSFGHALRAMLRADPDYLLLGEIRDSDAARVAVEAAGSGRVLMSTIHSPDSVGAVTAMRNFALADHEVATSLRMVVAQRLVRRLCRRCRQRERITEADAHWLASVGLPINIHETWVATGCEECRNLGYSGRVGLFEVWRLTDTDYDSILHHCDERALSRSATTQGLRSLLRDGWGKVEQGVTTIAELRTISTEYPSRQSTPGTAPCPAESV